MSRHRHGAAWSVDQVGFFLPELEVRVHRLLGLCYRLLYVCLISLLSFLPQYMRRCIAGHVHSGDLVVTWPWRALAAPAHFGGGLLYPL